MASKKRVPLPSTRPRKHKSTHQASTLKTAPDPTISNVGKRKRGRTKAVTSCERCRQAHIKCVSRGPGEPCENCAKRSIQTCTFARPSSESGSKKEDAITYSAHDQELQGLATSALAYMEDRKS
ncbi:hypothetical protein GGR54DRAFT_617184 [Hypoxylon sp. NC1633]|nr:hypothetical protein GGR54DRAFT_617184 [Hypoxylon sp. NC1633]